jgi:tetratricopeptide (TPR) repeat protein
VIVKYQRGDGDSAEPGWLPAVEDPADLFVLLYDALPRALTRQRPDLPAGLLSAVPAGDPAVRRIGGLLDSWYLDPKVQRCADLVLELAGQGAIDRKQVGAAAPAGLASAIFAVLLGLDRALAHAHPGQRGTSMRGLSAVGLRYLATGRLSTDHVSGALLPRRSPFDGPGRTLLAASFLSVDRIPGEIWHRIRHCRLPTQFDVGRRAASEEILLAVVPLLASEDLAVSVVRAGAGEPIHFRLEPRDSGHLRERIRGVLDALDHSGATIAALPDHALSPSLLTYWRELLRSSPAPARSKLKWILAGAGRAGPEAPSRSRAVVLDRDLGEVVLAQDKLLPSYLDVCQLTLRGLTTSPIAPVPGSAVEDGPPADRAEKDHVAEDFTAGTELTIADSAIGRIAVLPGEPPGGLTSALNHVTHLFRAESAAGVALPPSEEAGPQVAASLEEESAVAAGGESEGQAARAIGEPAWRRAGDAPPPGLVLSSSLLLSGLDPGGPFGGGAVALPVEESPAGAGQGWRVQMVTARVFEPDEFAVTAVSPSWADQRLRQLAPGPLSGAGAALRRLVARRLADPEALLRHGERELAALVRGLHPQREPRLVATALYLAARISATRGRLSAAHEALDRAIPAARAGDAQFLEARARALRCLLRWWGDQSLTDVATHAGAELDWAAAEGYPHLMLTALGTLAQAWAHSGVPGVTGLLDRAAALGEELILCLDSAEVAMHDITAAASVLLTQGDHREAAEVLGRGDWALRRIGAAGLRPPVLVLAARAYHHLGAAEVAHSLLDDCAKLAPGHDVAVQAGTHGVRALILAGQGDYVVAEQLARSAVKVGDLSERVDVQAQSRADLANVLARAGREREAALPAAWALHLYQQKGDLVGTAAIRELTPAAEYAVGQPLRAEAWVMESQPCLIAGRASKIGIRLHARTVPPGAAGEPSGTSPGQSPEVLVTLMAAGGATVHPHGQRLRLPRSGHADPLTFEVTPVSPSPLRLHFLVNLYWEGTLLQELGVTIPVRPRQEGYGGDGR